MRFYTTILSCLLIVCLAGCEKREGLESKKFGGLKIEMPPKKMDAVQAKIFNTNVTEELILGLVPRLGAVSDLLKGKEADLTPLFESEVDYRGPSEFDLDGVLASKSTSQDHVAIHADWPLAKESKATSDIAGDLWAPILKANNGLKFEDTQFGVVGGKLKKGAKVFDMKTVFEGRIRDSEGGIIGVKGKQTLRWYTEDGDNWKIGGWHQDELEMVQAPQPLFENVSEQAFDQATQKTLARSRHEEMLLDRVYEPDYMKRQTQWFKYFSDWHSSYQYGSVSVIDIDRDDWDDLFVLDRWGESTLLRNKGDGTFEDVTRDSGLRLPKAYANCAVFADFDNDGDSDVLIGRTVAPSLFFRNEDGKFVRDKVVNEELQQTKFVTCASAIDINRDGLTDVYLSTYCSIGGTDTSWVEFAVPEEQGKKLGELVLNSHSFLDRRGPPNIVMMNHDGVLKKTVVPEELMQWRNSFQSVWTDIDSDGDPDLYLCNDFAPDVFLRNDTERGSFDLKFVDITEEVFQGRMMGFGMGASFGDYNSDGHLDLYVSNMYSKAGRRIIDNFDGKVNKHMVISAQGNFLFKRNGSNLEQVAGLTPDKQMVAKVGWSFGGQLADVNNDKKLDVYVPSGLFSPPQEIDSKSDL